MIRISGLTKTYENGESRLYALNDVSAEIGDREFATLRSILMFWDF
ncbi:MAG: hypothetical protein LBT30_07980 [Clostridiales bacterium]|nr:hypothetical protein [Clostridiales bacterium]